MNVSSKIWTSAVLFGLLFAANRLLAQDTLLVAAGPQGPHLYHVVQPKENFYSLGRAFHLSPHVIAAFNHLDMHQGLKVLQAVKIPLTQENFNQSGTPASHRGAIPLYHRVLPGETLFHISHDYGSLSDQQLRSWNHLSGNDIRVGQDLLVGWLQPGSPTRRETAASAPAVAAPAAAELPVASASRTAPVAEATQGGGFLADVIASERAKVESSGAASQAPSAWPAKPAPAAAGTPSRASGSARVSTAAPAQPLDSFAGMLDRVALGSGPQPVAGRKTQAAQASSALQPNTPVLSPASTTTILPATPSPAAPSAPAASDFASLYDAQTHQGAELQDEKGAGAWFKSNVEPGSGRYYALFNGAQRGAVLKVTNPLNGKAVFVKVLDSIPKLAGNYNLLIKISDAAMEDLGVRQPRFWCKVSFAPSQAATDSGTAAASTAPAAP